MLRGLTAPINCGLAGASAKYFQTVLRDGRPIIAAVI